MHLQLCDENYRDALDSIDCHCGSHNVTITDTDGQSATAVNAFTVTSSGGISFGGGFGMGSMVLNGNAAISGTALSLTTTNGTFQASSAWYPTPVNIQNFTTDFSFQSTAERERRTD